MGLLSRLKFGVFYPVGFTPWDGHPLPSRLRELIEGQAALPSGQAIDIGCGTGDMSIYMARHGWTVRFLQADVKQLSRHLEPGSRFQLLLDGGCFHGLPSEAREVTTAAAPGATLLMMAFDQGKASPGVQGTSRAEIDQRMGVAWDVIADAIDAGVSTRPQWPIRIYELRRR